MYKQLTEAIIKLLSSLYGNCVFCIPFSTFAAYIVEPLLSGFSAGLQNDHKHKFTFNFITQLN